MRKTGKQNGNKLDKYGNNTKSGKILDNWIIQ